MPSGRVLAIFTAPASGAPMVAHTEIAAFAGKGLFGDRYAAAAGTYSGVRVDDADRAVTLFERARTAVAACPRGLGPSNARLAAFPRRR